MHCCASLVYTDAHPLIHIIHTNAVAMLKTIQVMRCYLPVSFVYCVKQHIRILSACLKELGLFRQLLSYPQTHSLTSTPTVLACAITLLQSPSKLNPLNLNSDCLIFAIS